MLFNSNEFVLFFPIVFLLYWFLASKKLIYQNIILLVASYFFYACWDWRFLFLLIFSTLLDFFTGLKMSISTNLRSKKIWFWLSIIVNLGFLGLFKYYNFFAVSFSSLISQMGFKVNPWTLNIILPVGISFYTFHGLSYVIDVYNNKIRAEKNFIEYSVFVCFFPLLVAGPIERATHLLPQIKTKRIFSYTKSVDALKQILWGLFKKVVIADNCAKFANLIFNNPSHYGGSAHLLGAIFFAFQIYGDFSGYSDIALGTARLLGIELLRNFNYPYFSRDIAEFWRRWHISLSSWFRDYLYIPLGGSKVSTIKKIRNTFIIFIVSGFWHGANWTFIVWGALNAFYFLPLLVSNNNRNNLSVVAQGKVLPNLRDLFSMLFTFALTLIAWIFFRAKDLNHAIDYIKTIFSKSLFSIPVVEDFRKMLVVLFMVLLFIIIEWNGREENYAIAKFATRWKATYRYLFYYTVLLLVFWFGINDQQFIYFQF